MVLYNWKNITAVPSHTQFIDVILSMTQRKTPTIVHRGYKISRIRGFYIRKVKYSASNFNDRLSLILDEFPRTDDVHPFYADLMNVLYSRDHYKLALGQVNTARRLINHLSEDYIKLIKTGDSLYRCKDLKRAALGRMATIVKKLKAALGFLEEVRQNLSRLPSIDPNTRTIMLTGFPNVGKSSFINKVTHANVDVQPYAFTTKSLFVGHTHYRLSRWQVIDTPGLLGHSLAERNTIEMQAITALAHLQSTVLFLIDVSETCSYSIEQQVKLFHDIKALFANKPVLVVCTKSDLRRLQDLPEQERSLVESLKQFTATGELMEMSAADGDNVDAVKNKACEVLLKRLVPKKLAQERARDIVQRRIQVVQPVKRDNRVRQVSIPESVQKVRAEQLQRMSSSAAEDEPELPRGGKKLVQAGDAPNVLRPHLLPQTRPTLKDIERVQGGAGVFSFDHRLHRQLENSDWTFDTIPQIMDGYNLADFIAVDEDINEQLARLEAEENEIQEAAFRNQGMVDDGEDGDNGLGDSDSELEPEAEELLQRIRVEKTILRKESMVKNSMNKAVLPRTAGGMDLDKLAESLRRRGLDPEKFLAAQRAKQQSSSLGKRRRNDTQMEDDMEDVEGDAEMKGGDSDDDADMEGGSSSRGRRTASKSVAARSQSRSRKAEAWRDPAREPSLRPSYRRNGRSRAAGEDGEVAGASRSRARSATRDRSLSGLGNLSHKREAVKRIKLTQMALTKDHRKGEGDRAVPNERPKHLYSGKMSLGTRSKR